MLFLKVFSIIPIDLASAIGGFLGRNIAIFTKEAKIADINLQNIMPRLTIEERKKIIREMMDNVGRGVAEFPHLRKLKGKKFDKRVEIVGLKNLMNNKACVPVTAHFGNWEICTPFAKRYNLKLSVIYKKPTNKWFNKILISVRRKNGVDSIAQGIIGVRDIIKRLKRGETVGIVADQRVSYARLVPFMGMDARTTMLPANITLKYKFPIIPTKVTRLKGANFRIEFMKPIKIRLGDNAKTITKRINNIFGEWIKKDPSQWMWANKRWRGLYDKNL